MKDRFAAERVSGVVAGESKGKRYRDAREKVVLDVLFHAGLQLSVDAPQRCPKLVGLAVGEDEEPDLVGEMWHFRSQRPLLVAIHVVRNGRQRSARVWIWQIRCHVSCCPDHAVSIPAASTLPRMGRDELRTRFDKLPLHFAADGESVSVGTTVRSEASKRWRWRGLSTRLMRRFRRDHPTQRVVNNSDRVVDILEARPAGRTEFANRTREGESSTLMHVLRDHPSTQASQ